MEIGVDTPQEPDSAIPRVAIRPSFDPVELGTSLRETRTALGRELVDVASDLRIRSVYLQAIEDGRLGDLPGNAYATGFLRAYGDYLGLDGGEIVAQYKASGGAAAGQTDLHLPSPVEEGRLPTASVLVLAAVLAVCAYGGWYYLASTDEDPVEQVAALPDRLVELVGKDGKPAPAEEPETVAAVVGSDPTVPAAGDEAPVATPRAVIGPEPAPDPARAVNGGAVVPQAPPERVPPQAPTGRAAVVSAPVAPSVTNGSVVPAPLAPEDVPARAEEPAPAAVPAARRETPPPPERVALPAPRPAPPARTVAPPERTAAAPARTAPAPALSAPAPTERDAAPDATAMVAPEAGAAARPPAAERPAARAGISRIVLRASTDSWVEVRADGADPVYSGLLRRGDTYVVPERPGLTMITGNAGGIEILVDGKAIPSLGPPGAVRRDVPLEVEALLSLSGQ